VDRKGIGYVIFGKGKRRNDEESIQYGVQTESCKAERAGEFVEAYSN